MNPTPCQSLDDYLTHDLTRDDRARFEAHLPICPECQRTVQEARRLAALLLEALAELEPVPRSLSERVEQRLRTGQLRRRVAAAAALAASMVVIVMIGRFVWRVQPPAPGEQVEVKLNPPVPAMPPAPEPVRVRFPNASGVLAVPVPFESSNVTLIRVYTGLREPAEGGRGDEADLQIPERSIP